MTELCAISGGNAVPSGCQYSYALESFKQLCEYESHGIINGTQCECSGDFYLGQNYICIDQKGFPACPKGAMFDQRVRQCRRSERVCNEGGAKLVNDQCQCPSSKVWDAIAGYCVPSK